MFRERFPFWTLEYGSLEVAPLLRRYGLGAMGAGLAVVGGLAFVEWVGWWRFGLFFLSLLVLGSHQFARERLVRLLPPRSFYDDLRTGNLDQFRLLLYQPHALLFQRFFPGFALHLMVNALWLPLYGVWSASLGLSPLDGVCWWLLLSFGSPFVLGVWLLTVLTASYGYQDYVVGLLLLAPLFPRMLESRSALWVGAFLALVVALWFVRLVPVPLPNGVPFVWVWLCVEGLRLHRLADWLNHPTGFARYLWLVPAVGLLMYALLIQWTESADLLSLNFQERWEFGVVALVVMTGWLSLVTLTVERGREPIQQTLGYHVKVSLLQRLLALGLVPLSVPILGVDVSNSAFWGVLAWVMIWGGLSSGVVRYLIQVNWAISKPMVYSALAVGLLPGIVAMVSLTSVDYLALFSPWSAVYSQTSLWVSHGLQAIPPLWAGLGSMVQSLLVVGWLFFGRMRAVVVPSWARRLVNALVGLLMFYPVLDKLPMTNPVSRLFRVERVPNYAFWSGVLGLALGLTLPQNLGLWLIGLVGLGIFLWLWGYGLTARRLAKLRDSGELTSFFLANLSATQVFWGLVYSSWYQQVRVLTAFMWATGVGYLLSYSISASTPLWVMMFLLVFSSSALVVFVLMWSCAWLIAPPMAIWDGLARAPQETGRGALHRVVAAFAATLLSLCVVIAPLLLIFVPIHSSQAIHRLNKLRQRPGEP